jgi:hypothetical protein
VIRSVTGRAHQFEPLNAKQLERSRPRDLSRWKRPARGLPSSVPIAQSTERASPKRQAAGESPAGDTSSCGCGSTAECGRAKAETMVRLRSPAPVLGGVTQQQSTRLTCERQRGQHSSLPPLSEGIAQPVRADASHASGRKCESSCPPRLSLWCSPVNTPASHAGDHRSEAGQGRHSPGPQSIVRDAFAR